MFVNKEKIKSILESLLFVGGDPVEITQISKVVGVEQNDARDAIMELKKEYKKRKGGFDIIVKFGSAQLVTNPSNSMYVEKLLKKETQSSLSKTALETLSIIVYRGPVSRTDIDAIRGVNSSFILRNLLIRGLIEKSGNPKDSRGYVYSVTTDFMKELGVSRLEQLPDYEKLSKDEKIELIVKNNK
ncbi:SMC-Scp complex subunit ScpB [Patescibacteria group bacterium]